MADKTDKIDKAELMARIDSIGDIEVPDNLEEILRKVAKKDLTKEERRAQRISWVMGMMPRGMKMSREEVTKLITERYG